MLKDVAQNFVRNQLASVPGASVPQPFGGRWRQIMLYADPYKLEANQLSPMDVVRSINDSNVILPAGDVQIGRYDYNIYTNAMLKGPQDIAQVPLKMVGQSPVRVGDVAIAKDSFALQYNIVRVNGQRARVPADLQAGRRLEHDRNRQRCSRQAAQALRRSELDGQQGGFRSVALCENRDRDAAP